MIVVTVDKQTGAVIGRPEIITRGFVHGNEQDPIMEEAIERVIDAIENPGDHISEIAPAQEPDQGRRVALPVRADEAAADGLPGRGRGLTWPPPRAAARRPATPRPRGARPARSIAARRRGSTPDVARSLIGADAARPRRGDADRLCLPGEGSLTQLVDGRRRALVREPALAAAVPAACSPAGTSSGAPERGRARAGGSPLLGVAITYAGLRRARPRSSGVSGGRIGACPGRQPRPTCSRTAGRVRPARRPRRSSASSSASIPLRQLDPAGASARPAGWASTAAAAAPARRRRTRTAPTATVRPPRERDRAGGRGDGEPVAPARRPSPGQTGIWGDDDERHPGAVPSAAPTSATFAPARAGGAASAAAGRRASGRVRDPTTSPTPPTRRRPGTAIEYVLPPLTHARRHRHPAQRRRRRDRPPPERGRSSSRSSRASTSRPRSSAATPGRW